jgi:hypothetical protein
MTSQAESAALGDTTITDSTDYRYCMNKANHITAQVRPPYYVELLCTDFHSANPLLHPRCHNVPMYSYCNMQDCKRNLPGSGAPIPQGGAATLQYVCASVDEYGEWTIIDTNAPILPEKRAE